MSKAKPTSGKKSTGTAVAKVDHSSKLPAKMEDRMLQFQGAGMETVTARDITIPRITILQGLSPQCLKSKPEFIKGAEPGMLCDTSTGQLWDGEEGIILLPVMYQLSWLEWAPRKTNRGLIMIHGDDEILKTCTKTEKGQVTPEGNTIIETAQFYVLNRSADDRQAFVPFAGSQRKKAKKWLDLSTSERIKHSNGTPFVPPLFYREYKLTTRLENNDQGEWFGWVIERGDNVTAKDDDLFHAALNYLKAVQSGAAKMSTDQLMREATQEANRGERM